VNLFNHIAVLYGGGITEREVSLTSGQATYQALIENDIQATLIDVAQDDYIKLLQSGKFSCVFVALHGGFGEDGTIQGLLECLGLPYTGSGVSASALAMDKEKSKIVLRAHGLPVLPSYAIEHNFIPSDFPLALKPNSQGSSFGVFKINSKVQLMEQYEQVVKYGDVLIEPWIDGPEYTSGVVGDKVLSSINIIPKDEFNTFDAKYISDATQFICPGSDNLEFEGELASIARRAFDALGLNGWGRVDYMVSTTGEIYILELNTIPGLTSHSLVPTAAKTEGISFFELICKIIECSNLPGVTKKVRLERQLEY